MDDGSGGEGAFAWWANLPRNEHYVLWRSIPEGVARLQWPEEELQRRVAEDGIRQALQREIQAGSIVVLNPHEGYLPVEGNLPIHGGVISRPALERFLNKCGVGLRLVDEAATREARAAATPETGVTLEEAADAIQLQQQWTDAQRDSLLKQMMDAARLGELRVRHPHTGLIYRPSKVRGFNELVKPIDVNRWLMSDAGNSLRWIVDVAEEAPSEVGDESRAPVASEPAPDRGRRLKRAALIAENRARWPTIERDLKEAAANGLGGAARDGGAVGWWWEGSAIDWARARAKLSGAVPGPTGTGGTIHRMGR